MTIDADKTKDELIEEISSLRKKVECMEKHSRELDECAARSRRDIKDQLELAAKVHRTLLPEPFENDNIKVDMKYYPLEEIGGDYSQVRFTEKNICYITACDVTGHGVGSAILATRISSEVRRYILEGLSPGHIVKSLNSFIVEFFAGTNLYPSFFASKIDFNKKNITWSGAGHPCPVLLKRDTDNIIYLKSQSSIIGIDKDIISEREEDVTDIASGDRLLFYSDGVIDSSDSSGQALGTQGLAGMARDLMGMPFYEMGGRLHGEINEYRCGPQHDDELLILAEIV